MAKNFSMSAITPFSETKRKLLEMCLRGDRRVNSTDLPPISRRASGSPPPLSLAQEQIWLSLQEPRDLPPVYNESITLHRLGPLNVAVLERCLSEIIRRHEIWRTTVATLNGHPVQIIHPAPDTYPCPVVDLRGLPVADRESEAIRLATEEARRPFDLLRGPLVRVMLATLSDEEHRLFFTMHQMIVDGVSAYRVLPSELVALYQAFSAGRPSPLPELPIQYADFACWQRQWLQGEALDQQSAYWREKLAGELPVLDWPTDRPRPPVQTYRGSMRPFTLPRNLSDTLRASSQRQGVTLFTTLLAGFVSLLHLYTGREVITVGTLAPAGRKRAEVQGLLGYFLNPVALRIDLSGNPTFREVLEQARGVISGALSHDDVPLERLANELKPKPDPTRHPFFQIMFSLAPPMSELGSGWSQTPMDVESGGARWDLYLELNDRQNGILGRAQYNPDLFDVSAITRMLEDYQYVLHAASSNPEHRPHCTTAAVPIGETPPQRF